MSTRLLLSAVTRLVGSVVIGVIVGLAVGLGHEAPLGILSGIVSAATVFVIAGWFVLRPMSPAETERVARREDFQPFIEELSVVAAALTGLVGIVVVLVLRHSNASNIAAAVSDTNVSNEKIRAIALRHCLLSYIFGTVILATTINLVAGPATD